MSERKFFVNNLARGLDFERNVADRFLRRRFPTLWIKNHTEDPGANRGPRAFRGQHKDEEVVYPDFELWSMQLGLRFWVDAKLKKSPYSSQAVSRPGARYFTIDKGSNQKYFRGMPHLQGDLYLLFGCEQTKNLYLGPWNPNPETVYFNNRYGTGYVPIYYLDDLLLVGKF